METANQTVLLQVAVLLVALLSVIGAKTANGMVPTAQPAILTPTEIINQTVPLQVAVLQVVIGETTENGMVLMAQ